MASFFERLRTGLAKTAQQIRERLGEAAGVPATAAGPAGVASARTGGALTVEAIEDALIGADVGLAGTERILAAMKTEREGTPRERVARVVLRMLSELPPPPAIDVRPHVILVVGVNGTGKTTTVGKLAHYYQNAGRSVMVCAADTFRAAAVEQLAVWAARSGVDIVRAQSGADPAAVTFDAVSAARARGRDVVLVDTAGRLHTRANLMAELAKIRRIVAREVPGAPHEVLLVLDATVGQNGLTQAREFMLASGANGIVLTKLDGTAKGGVAVAIAHELKLPIRFVGVGEGLDDLLPFDAAAYVDAIFTERMVDPRDRAFMERALFLAERGRGRTTPNPVVGAVVVTREGIVVGQGAHLRAGGPHAEVVALDVAGARAAGATLYCTLEPCSHHGRTAPCVERVVAAGIARVVVATIDPNPRVAGAGLAYLRARGVDVTDGCCRDEAARQNAPFFIWVTAARPFMLLKTAVSRDGFAGRPDRRVLLTGERANQFFQQQRAGVDAIAVGAGTVLVDDPQLTARGAWRERPLTRVLFDWRGRISPAARVFSTLSAGPVIMVVSAPAAEAGPERVRALEDLGAIVHIVHERRLRPVLEWLAGRDVVSLLVEGGPGLHAACRDEGLIDRVQYAVTPHVLGEGVPPAVFTGPDLEGMRWPSVTILGRDALIEFDVHRSH